MIPTLGRAFSRGLRRPPNVPGVVPTVFTFVYVLVDPVGGQLLSLALTAPPSVLGYGVIADAYVQLSADEASPRDDGDAGTDGSGPAT